MNCKELHELSENLFAKKGPLTSLHQELADNFYPERADFTVRRPLGTDFAANLMTSYPILCRRDLGNQFSTMLRPTAKPWFHHGIRFQKESDNEVKRWLEYFEETQRKAMYDPVALFTRATKEGDHDFAAFGQAVLSIDITHASRSGPHLLYRCWHIRDVCWQEDERGQISTIFRRWKPTLQQVKSTFRKVHQKVNDNIGKTPFAELECVHFVVPSEMYDGAATRKQPWYSVWYDIANDFVMDETPLWVKPYVIPRWQTVSGSQYSYSPATVAALPDARLIQAMTYTLLEAGEKATSPPVIATQDAVRSDVALFAGGITWVDAEYDEKLGEALRPLTQDFRGFNFGVQMAADSRAMIKEAFFLNKLTLPERAPEMTAYEVGQRIQEYIRNALPIFEPMEAEYNAAVCDTTFELMWRAGAFGPMDAWPKKLRGAEIEFTFESPLHDAIDAQKGHKVLEAKALLADAVAIDPSAIFMFDVKVALREALAGIQVPAKWVRPPEEVDRMQAQQEQKQAAQEMLASMQQASEVAGNLAGAQKATAETGVATVDQPMPMAA